MKKYIFLLLTLTNFSCLEEVDVQPANDYKTNWSEERVLFIGDSNTDEKLKPFIKYPTVLNNDLNFKSIKNSGSSGMAMAKIASNNYLTKDNGLLNSTIWGNYDVVFISLGGNDVMQSVPLGDINSTDVNTFYGAYKAAIKYIKLANNDIKIILLNHPQHARLNQANLVGYKSVSYAQAVVDVAKYYNVACIDSYNSSPFTESNSATYTSDGIHLNTEGHELYGSFIINELRKF